VLGTTCVFSLACARGADRPPTDSQRADSASQPGIPQVVARCYRSSSSVLLGPRTKSGQQGRGPGWLRLEGSVRAESGAAQLVDADGKALNANWHRGVGDSLQVVIFNDFVRVDIRVAEHEGVVEGRGEAYSDAAAERDSAGRLVDLRRAWRLRAVEVTCDRMPRAGLRAPVRSGTH